MKTTFCIVLISALCGTFYDVAQARDSSRSKVHSLLEKTRAEMDPNILQVRDGFAGAPCTSDVDCQTGRECVRSICTPSGEEALCDCTDPDCIDGEVCTKDEVCFSASIADQSPQGLLNCPWETIEPESVTESMEPSTPEPGPTTSPGTGSDPSTSPSPNASPSQNSGVCVDARLLSDFEPHELVFENHSLAPVLCDASGSCATKGHIVHYKGSAMMMSSYCLMVGCKEHVMEVNSPVRKRGLKVKTHSEDLKFTAFAARYETKAEELVLSTAVHMGM